MSIEAMKQALEYLDSPSSKLWPAGTQYNVITSLRQAIEQAEKQKPVTYQYQNKEGNWCPFLNDKHYADTLKDGTWPIRSLYTTPQPQREWVGLTDAEIEEFDYYARDLVMDIEKALKERNNVA